MLNQGRVFYAKQVKFSDETRRVVEAALRAYAIFQKRNVKVDEECQRILDSNEACFLLLNFLLNIRANTSIFEEQHLVRLYNLVVLAYKDRDFPFLCYRVCEMLFYFFFEKEKLLFSRVFLMLTVSNLTRLKEVNFQSEFFGEDSPKFSKLAFMIQDMELAAKHISLQFTALLAELSCKALKDENFDIMCSNQEVFVGLLDVLNVNDYLSMVPNKIDSFMFAEQLAHVMNSNLFDYQRFADETIPGWRNDVTSQNIIHIRFWQGELVEYLFVAYYLIVKLLTGLVPLFLSSFQKDEKLRLRLAETSLIIFKKFLRDFEEDPRKAFAEGVYLMVHFHNIDNYKTILSIKSKLTEKLDIDTAKPILIELDTVRRDFIQEMKALTKIAEVQPERVSQGALVKIVIEIGSEMRKIILENKKALKKNLKDSLEFLDKAIQLGKQVPGIINNPDVTAEDLAFGIDQNSYIIKFRSDKTDM